MDSHVKISLTVHFEASVTTWDHTFEVFLQSMHDSLVVAQLILISEFFVAILESAPEYFYFLVNGKMAFQTRPIFKRFVTVAAHKFFMCT